MQETDRAIDKKCVPRVQSTETKFKYRGLQNKAGEMIRSFLYITELLGELNEFTQSNLIRL